MYTLGIETSCDETAGAVLKNGTTVCASTVSSSINLHRKFGGIIPEIASRFHLEYINPVIEEALKKAQLSLADIKLIAVTCRPGLIGSLLVGLSFAKTLSLGRGIPFIGVNHIHAHLFAPFLNQPRLRFPFIGLIVSGGHTSLMHVKDVTSIRVIGQTRDDACGEAYDKVAKLLGLGYPGGPEIDALAQTVSETPFRFTCGRIKDSFDFSFSGIKTAVMYTIRDRPRLTKKSKAEICLAFQKEVIAALVEKSITACLQHRVSILSLGGGVACNSHLRAQFIRACAAQNITLLLSPPAFCQDNAAMIAALGYHLYRKGKRSAYSLNANASSRPRKKDDKKSLSR